MRKAFKCTIVTDQQVLASSTLPSAMKERYQSCDKPPRLQEMNPYRDDNKDALKFYTDPTYFFELWCEEMRKETEKKKRKRVSTNDFFSIYLEYKILVPLSFLSGEERWIQLFSYILLSGKSTHLPPMRSAFGCRTKRHTCMWVEFVVGFHLCSESFFSGYSGFPLSSKTNTSKFQFDLESVPN